MQDATAHGREAADLEPRRLMPNPLWTILADPANRPMLALTAIGLVVIVFGPWAIVKLAERRPARDDGSAGE